MPIISLPIKIVDKFRNMLMIVPIIPIKSASKNNFLLDKRFISGPDIKHPIKAPTGIDASLNIYIKQFPLHVIIPSMVF
jgi:hypothetical protein